MERIDKKNHFKIRYKRTISVGKILMFFLLCFYFEPAGVQYIMPSINELFKYGRFGVSCAYIAYYVLLLYKEKRKPSKIILLSICFWGLQVISTIWNGGDNFKAIYAMIAYTALCCICERLMRKFLMYFLDIICMIFEILIIMNFISLFLYPNGMYTTSIQISSNIIYFYSNNWLLGLDNTFIIYMLPAIIFSIIRTLKYRNDLVGKIRMFLLIGISIVTTIERWQATTVLCLALLFMVCFLIFFNKKGEKSTLGKILNGKTYVLANIIFFIGIVILKMQYLFSYIIEKVLHKELTMSSRTRIWDKSFIAVKKEWLLGYGYESVGETVGKIGLNSTHNYYLWVIYLGGLITFFVFMLIIFNISKRLQKEKTNIYIIVAATGFGVLMLMWQVEAVMTYSIFIFLVFLYYLPEHISERKG